MCLVRDLARYELDYILPACALLFEAKRLRMVEAPGDSLELVLDGSTIFHLDRGQIDRMHEIGILLNDDGFRGVEIIIGDPSQ